MEKQEIISFIEDVRVSHDDWLEQGKIILDGLNLDRLEEPVRYSECDFSHWCASNKNKVSAFSWFEELQQLHEQLHKTYSDLFYDSMRKYNPKTMGELLELFESLKSESVLFKNKLDEIESELYKISFDSFNDLVEKSESDHVTQAVENSAVKTDEDISHNIVEDAAHKIVKVSDVIELIDADSSDTTNNKISEDIVTDFLAIKLVADSQAMQDIDICLHDEKQNPFDELESLEPIKSVEQHDSIKMDDEVVAELEVEDIAPLTTDAKDVIQSLNASANINRQISLKEQSLVQLKQEKELSKLELSHLDETQKLTQKSVEQLEQYYSLKQEEIESEQTDNGGFIEFKTQEKQQVEDELTDIEEKKSVLKNDIEDLEKQNIEDQLEQERKQKETSIVKQFEELKLNKNKHLKELQEHKKVRENDLTKLKEQKLLLEGELSGMEEDIDRKQKDLLDLDGKEQLKNEERAVQRAEQEEIQQQRTDTIIDKQKELVQLSDEEQVKQNKIDTINFQVEELNNDNELMVETNSDELKELELQQKQKRGKLLETEKLKSTKQAIISDIELHIQSAERSLEKLKVDQDQSEADQSDSELVTTQ